MEEYYDLTLTNEGRIILKEWFYDETIKKGEYLFYDVTDDPYRYLLKSCKIEDGFTLDHLFKIVSNQSYTLNLIMRNCWIESYIAHYRANRDSWVLADHQYAPDGIEYLELYWYPEVDDYGTAPYLFGADMPNFHGIGWELQEDKWEDWNKEEPSWRKGARISWGIDFSPIETLLHLPIRLNEKFAIRDSIKNWSLYDESIPVERRGILAEVKKKYTLQNVIEGVFWELSFYGSPSDKDEKSEELKERMDEVNEAIESGDTSKFIAVGSPEWDDLTHGLLGDNDDNAK